MVSYPDLVLTDPWPILLLESSWRSWRAGECTAGHGAQADSREVPQWQVSPALILGGGVSVYIGASHVLRCFQSSGVRWGWGLKVTQIEQNKIECFCSKEMWGCILFIVFQLT